MNEVMKIETVHVLIAVEELLDAHQEQPFNKAKARGALSRLIGLAQTRRATIQNEIKATSIPPMKMVEHSYDCALRTTDNPCSCGAESDGKPFIGAPTGPVRLHVGSHVISKEDFDK
jgi:hypothetical protein